MRRFLILITRAICIVLFAFSIQINHEDTLIWFSLSQSHVCFHLFSKSPIAFNLYTDMLCALKCGLNLFLVLMFFLPYELVSVFSVSECMVLEAVYL